MKPNAVPGTHAPFSRRTLLVSMVAAPVVAALVAACGDNSTDSTGSSPDGTEGVATVPPVTDVSSPIQHPTGSSDVVIRFGYEGGFVAPGTIFVNTPTLLISGDGKLYRPGVTTMQYPGPLVAPMAVRAISEAGIQKLLAAADEAGLLAPPPDYTATINVADVPDTVVIIQAGKQTYEHRAYALGFNIDSQGNPAPESTPARAALEGFTLLLGDVETAVGADQLGAESVVVPTEYRLQATPVVEADLAGLDPAPTIVDWPATTGLDLATAAQCARVTADAVGSLFSDATSNTYFRHGDALFALSVAGVLPGDPVC